MSKNNRYAQDANAKKRRTRIIISIVVTVVLLFGVFIAQKYLSDTQVNGGLTFFDATHPTVRVHIIDVGQGDSVFVELPQHRAMLIDGGDNAHARTVIGYISKLGYKKIDYLIASHPHEDHIGGLDEVVKSFSIGEIYMPKVEYDTKSFTDLLEEIAAKGLSVSTARAGVCPLSEEGLKIEFLAPVEDSYDEINSYSAVVKLTYGNNKFLFMADATDISESDIVRSGADVDADVIKIGHHGSVTSSSSNFMKAVSPQYAAISLAADNDYGYPHKEVVTLLESLGTHIYRTDIDGTVIFTGNGERIKVTKEK